MAAHQATPSLGSLLIDSCSFSILFSRFLIIFTIITLNSFSGSLPISSFYLDFCVSSLFLHLCSIALPFHIVFEVSFSQASGLNSCFLLVSALLRLVQGEICAELFCLFVCMFVFPLMGKAEWGDNPVCWWLGLYSCFVCCLDEASWTGCYWWLGDAGPCFHAFFVWVLTIWYSLELVPW